MANHYSHAALPYPIRNARFTIPIPYLDADGDPTDPTTPDTEISKDAGAFADCTEEVSTISGSNGMGYITLTSSEMDASLVCLAAKAASGPKATLAMLQPRILPVLHNGTAQAGASASITLASTAPAYDLIGCIVRTTGGTGGGSGGNQARVITAYDTSTKVATVSPAWETNPSSDTTYDVLLTDMASNSPVTRGLRPTADGNTLDVAATGEAGVDLSNIKQATGATNLSNITLTDLTTLIERVTDARMGALTDWINGGRLDLLLDALLDRITETRAGYLDYLANATYGLSALRTLLVSTGIALTAAERTAIANEVEAQIIDDTDSEKVLTAITDKIASVNPSLGDLTLAAIASAVWSALVSGITTENSIGKRIIDYLTGDIFARIGANGAGLTALGDARLNNLDAMISSRLAALGYTAPDNATITAILEDTRTTIPGLIAALNNLSSAQSQSAAAAALAAYDPPTKAELDSAVSQLATASALAMVDGIVDSILEDTGTTIPAQISGLNNLSSAQVTTAVDTALGTAVSEPTGISDKSVKGLLWHLFARFYHKNTQTASAQTTYKANGTTVLATRTASDDGTTQTLGAAE